MKRRASVVMAAAAATAIAGLTPAFAAADRHKPKPKPLKGSWAYADYTPDPTVEVAENAQGAPQGCSGGKLPAGPLDVNVHTIKVSGPGTLTVAGANKLDWAMEIDDSKGNYLSGSDGGTPNVAEGTQAVIAKAGTYKVVYCNLTGEPTISATYTFVYR